MMITAFVIVGCCMAGDLVPHSSRQDAGPPATRPTPASVAANSPNRREAEDRLRLMLAFDRAIKREEDRQEEITAKLEEFKKFVEQLLELESQDRVKSLDDILPQLVLKSFAIFPW